jgi:hypothetical protein
MSGTYVDEELFYHDVTYHIMHGLKFVANFGTMTIKHPGENTSDCRAIQSKRSNPDGAPTGYFNSRDSAGLS